MTTTGDSPLPEGSWTHAFEEDADGIEVYRPTLGHPFPPSRRGRARLTFGSDGVVESEPGPDDRPRPRAALPAAGPGRFGDHDTPQGAIEIIEATPDLLRIRRTTR